MYLFDFQSGDGTCYTFLFGRLPAASPLIDHYTVFGYDGKQVRDNIHSRDLVRAFAAFHARPGAGAVYNIGGGRDSNCSILEVESR